MSTSLLRAPVVKVLAPVILALAALVVIVATQASPVGAAFPDQNGKIAFASNRDGNFEVYVMDSDGSNQTNLSNNEADDRIPDWGLQSDSAPQCTVTGTEDGEVLEGTPGPDVICGLGGNDTINGGGGNDRLVGGPGDDTLNGGPGRDTASYKDSATPIEASLTTGLATGEGSDSLVKIENLVGSIRANGELSGSNRNNGLRGRGGADVLSGGGGVDGLRGNNGNDTLDSQDGVSGNDIVDGGPGTDTCTTDATEAFIVSCEL